MADIYFRNMLSVEFVKWICSSLNMDHPIVGIRDVTIELSIWAANGLEQLPGCGLVAGPSLTTTNILRVDGNLFNMFL